MRKCDIAVIGGGHAGTEAALAAARLGCRVMLFCVNLDSIANLPCNPNIGGTAKGHLVREIDALGGEMGKVADKTLIQSRVLNRSKGPAVFSLRAQIDRKAYQAEMKRRLELQDNLDIIQSEVTKINISDGEITSVVTHLGLEYKCKAVIIATGTYLRSRIIIGDYSTDSGPDGLQSANALSQNLIDNGIKLLRFKTGTPPRVNRRSINFDSLELQQGDDVITPFSFETERTLTNKADCHITYTNEKTHSIIKDNLYRSPLYSGDIEGVGARYCPSIEDKIVRFADKDRHQIFIEPTGLNTEEMYIQGLSSSLPVDVQENMLHSIEGMEHAEVMRYAYAIEYDCADPVQMNVYLEFKEYPGLYGAGQFCGSSGYEEAAALGLISGINAARKILGLTQIAIDRSMAYIGTLIDDLTIKGTNEPYRMMTSRSEYRLLLRQDNADLRLTELGHEIGLIDEERYTKFCEKRRLIEKEIERLKGIVFPPSEALAGVLEMCGSSPCPNGVRASDLLKRPEITYDALAGVDGMRPKLSCEVKEQVEISIKYEGYILRQASHAQQIKRLENRKLPSDIDYSGIEGLRLEARQKLNAVRPLTIGQASRISGVTPADIAVLIILDLK